MTIDVDIHEHDDQLELGPLVPLTLPAHVLAEDVQQRRRRRATRQRQEIALRTRGEPRPARLALQYLEALYGLAGDEACETGAGLLW